MMESQSIENLLGGSARVRPDVQFIRDKAARNDAAGLALQYDFDFVPSDVPNEYMATFRSHETVEAIREAGLSLTNFLERCGFALVALESGVPPGHHLPADTDLREELVSILHKNLSSTDAETIQWGRFDPAALMVSIEASRPIRDSSLIDTPIGIRQWRKELERQTRRKERRRRLKVYALALVMLLAALSLFVGLGSSRPTLEGLQWLN